MTNIRIVENLDGVEQVIIENEDGSYTSMAKTVWEELETQKELGGTL